MHHNNFSRRRLTAAIITVATDTIPARRMSSFAATWTYPAELKKSLNAQSYRITALAKPFRSGRQRYECVFYAGQGIESPVISVHTAMCLTSRKGEPYHVVMRAPYSHRATTSPDADTSDEKTGANDPLEDVYR